VLGHEIGHVTARHSVTQISQQQLFGLGLGVGSIFSSRFRQLSGLAETGLGILMLKYSRDHERQSDQLGVEYMSQVEYDPAQMSRFFEVFQSMREEQGQAIPNWLSSHPAPPNRIKSTASAAEKIKLEHPGIKYRINADAFLSQINGIVYGDNPREGFVEKNRFYHPDLRFQFSFPQGWDVQNTKQSVTFVEPEGKAAIELTLVPPEEGQTPEDVAYSISRQEGIALIEGSRLRINGNSAYLGRYRLQSSSSSIEVLASFIAYGKNLYQLAGMTSSSQYNSFSNTFDRTIRDFRPLTDSRIMSVQPDRLRIYRAKKGETIRGLWKSKPQSRISVDDIALLNRLDPDQALSAGAPVKLMVLGR
jgi:predicted Zn-dependent protease